MATFSIHAGVKNLQPVFTVIEKRGARVVETRQFDDSGEAHDYVQSALYADEQFRRED